MEVMYMDPAPCSYAGFSPTKHINSVEDVREAIESNDTNWARYFLEFNMKDLLSSQILDIYAESEHPAAESCDSEISDEELEAALNRKVEIEYRKAAPVTKKRKAENIPAASVRVTRSRTCLADVKEESTPAPKEEEEAPDERCPAAAAVIEEDIPDKVRSPEEYYEIVNRINRTDREWLFQLKRMLPDKQECESCGGCGVFHDFNLGKPYSPRYKCLSCPKRFTYGKAQRFRAPNGSCKKKQTKKNKKWV